jgi:regulatory protein
MDNGEPEESSSSQNDNSYITDIKKRRTKGSTIAEVLLSDGSSFFVFFSFIDRIGLEAYSALTERLQEELQFESRVCNAYMKAVELIERAEHSEGRLRTKLMQRRYPPAAVDSVICLLRENNLLNNRRFAEHWVEVRLIRHPEGRTALIAGLIKRGVDRYTAESVVNENVTENREMESLVKAGEKLSLRHRGEYTKVSRALLRRGFPSVKVRYFIDNNIKNGKNKA